MKKPKIKIIIPSPIATISAKISDTAAEAAKIIIENDISIEDINARIKNEVCYEALEELTDTKLMFE